VSDRAAAIRDLRNEVDCRIEHGAESGGHLEFVRDRLDAIIAPDDYSPEFRDWLTRGSPGSVQRERYDRAVLAWNRGASEAEVAEIMGLKPQKDGEPRA